jgi:hypothetical protein
MMPDGGIKTGALSGTRRAVRLCAALVSAVLAFDLCSVLAPDITGAFLGTTGAFTGGVLFAGLIVLAVVIVAVVHVRRLNIEESDPPPSGGITGGA